ncbi:ArsR/SmtB family transcription factor [Pseudomonas sp. CFBP 13719]|uniref:ArsR/SmtB family transcription factor n=1 Tax=Pseudomonas sp. CFBP 13719 TaxID=2775303 RepID=UPI0017833E76|nr:helix-turn-helix domain-containing protein [Pseudomonas sp. CFBP 13719]MBD8680201.1 winged helix-turn-helix transcriptional regulator [Pseudomonas sp. CFBP 13719]
MTALNEALKVLSSPTRRAVLTWLKDPHRSFEGYSQLYDFSVHGVCASLIQDKAGLSQPATSICLKALLDQGFVEASKVGKWTYYRRNEKRLREAMSGLLIELEVDTQDS